jgi:Ca-activated chloride channel homolog
MESRFYQHRFVPSCRRVTRVTTSALSQMDGTENQTAIILGKMSHHRRTGPSFIALAVFLCGSFPHVGLSASANAVEITKARYPAMNMLAGPQAAAQKSKTPGSHDPSASAQSDDSLLTLRAAVSEVHLVFFVTDKHGHYVKNLTQDDFEIRDDHKPPQEILGFRSETDLPLEVGLLIDTSQSVRDRFQFEQQAATDFLKQTLRRGYDRAFVMGFDQTSKVTQDFTDDPDKLAAGIRKLQPGNLTAMFDAVEYACHEKLSNRPLKGPVRRLVILLSDGNDNASSATRAKTIATTQQAEVSVFAISTAMARSGGPGYKNLQSLAEATGGRSYVPIRIAEVADAFAAVGEGLRSQYSLSYRAADFKPDGHYRSIEVEIKNRRGLRVHCRKGYRSLAPG